MESVDSTDGKGPCVQDIAEEKCSELEEMGDRNELPTVVSENGDTSDVIAPFYHRLKRDRLFRVSVVHTFCIALAGLVACWHITIVGVTLPDIMMIIDKDLSTSSWILTAISVGNLVGALSIGVLYDRFNKLLVLVGIMSGIAITSLITPWCSNFAAMLAIHFVGGTFAVAGHSVCTADMIFVWGKESGPYLLFIHFAIGVGGSIGPLISEPFLAKRFAQYTVTNQTESLTDVTTTQSASFPMELPALVNNDINNVNFTTTNEYWPTYDSSLVPVPEIIHNSTKYGEPISKYGETRVVFAYFILAAFSVFVVLLFAITTLLLGDVYKMRKPKGQSDNQKATATNKLSKVTKAMLIFLQALLITLYITIQKHLSGFFMVFVIDKLTWTKSSGSAATSVFWIAFGVSRLLAVLVVQKWRQGVLFMVYMGTFTFGIAIFIVFSFFNIVPGVFVALALWGFGMAPLLAFMFTWLSENVTMVTGKVTSVVYVFVSLFGMISPVISARLMETLSFDYFLYISGFYAFCFIVLHFSIKILFNVFNK